MARPGKKKKTALFIVEIICLLVFICGLYVYGQIDSRLNKIETPQLDESKIVTNVTAPQMSGYTTYALFAIDQRSKNAALDVQNSDTIIIASINNDTKDVKLASVYRDTLLDIGNDTYTKANAAYAYGGPEQAISMLNTMLDLNITDYVTVNFNAMVAAVDALGGLDLPLSYAEMVFMNDYCIETSQETGKSYTPVELPDPKPENEEETLGEYHLNGVQVVSYCRIRYTASMDMGRTERQRRVIGLMVDKAKSAGLTTLFNIMDEVFPMIKTNFTKTELIQLGMGILSYQLGDTQGFPKSNIMGEDVKDAIGIDCVVPTTLEANVKQLHAFLFDQEDYSPSETVLKRSDYIAAHTGFGNDYVSDELKQYISDRESALDDEKNSDSEEEIDTQSDASSETSADDMSAYSQDSSSSDNYSNGNSNHNDYDDSDYDYEDNSDDYSGYGNNNGYYNSYNEDNSDGDESGSYNSEESDDSDNSYSDDNTYSEEEE